MSGEAKSWVKAIGISLVIFIIFSLYLVARRGYFNFYILNKVLGSTAALLSAITLLIGPLSKRFLYFVKFTSIRKQLGLIAFGLALAHVAASLTLQSKFPFPSWYIKEIIPILFGITALAIWTYITYISRAKKVTQLGEQVWRNRLSMAGKLSFLAIFFHLVIMKYEGWIKWFNHQVKQTPELANPSYPPASLFVFIFMLGVIIYRVVNTYLFKKQSKS